MILLHLDLGKTELHCIENCVISVTESLSRAAYSSCTLPEVWLKVQASYFIRYEILVTF